jgi:hypothetical protein
MTVFAQLSLGSALLALCSLLHVACLVGAAVVLAKLAYRHRDLPAGIHSVLIITVAVAALIVAHTVEVWLWAISLLVLGAVSNVSDAVYFSLATYTTVGYGDVVLGPEYRVFGAMAAVTGMLVFGLSTAFLVAILTRHFPNARFH